MFDDAARPRNTCLMDRNPLPREMAKATFAVPAQIRTPIFLLHSQSIRDIARPRLTFLIIMRSFKGWNLDECLESETVSVSIFESLPGATGWWMGRCGPSVRRYKSWLGCTDDCGRNCGHGAVDRGHDGRERSPCRADVSRQASTSSTGQRPHGNWSRVRSDNLPADGMRDGAKGSQAADRRQPGVGYSRAGQITCDSRRVRRQMTKNAAIHHADSGRVG